MAKTKIDFKKIAVKTICTGAGAVGGAMLNKIEFVEKQKPALRGLIKVGTGVAISAFLGNHKQYGAVADAVASGMIAVGAVEGASALITVPALSGIGEAMQPVVSGVRTIGRAPWPAHAR